MRTMMILVLRNINSINTSLLLLLREEFVIYLKSLVSGQRLPLEAFDETKCNINSFHFVIPMLSVWPTNYRNRTERFR